MDQDVKEITFSPMDAEGLVVKYVRSGWLFSQNAEIGQEDFLNCLVTGMKIEQKSWSLLRRALSRLIPLARCRLVVIKLRG